MADSSIEWTDATWNPTVGCSIASPGCTNCYAMRMAARLDAMGVEKYKGITRKTGGRYKWTGKVRLDANTLKAPLSWRNPKRVFVNSMSDLFHEDFSLTLSNYRCFRMFGLELVSSLRSISTASITFAAPLLRFGSFLSNP